MNRQRIKKRPMARNWFGTVWLQEDIEYIKKFNYKYLIISDDDHTQEEQLHWHVLLRSPYPILHPGTQTAHWEVAHNVTESRNYCLEKGPNYQEFGTWTGEGGSDTWKLFVNACKTLSPKEMIDSEWSRYYASFRGFAGEVRTTFKQKEIIDGELENYWLTGLPGTGKTKWAWDNYPDLYVKDLNKWWDGYNYEETVLLDDWDPRQEMLTQKLKIWSDRYPFRAETKGSSLMIRPKRIIITSNYTIDECFTNTEDAAAIKRRFHTIRFLGLNQHETLD